MIPQENDKIKKQKVAEKKKAKLKKRQEKKLLKEQKKEWAKEANKLWAFDDGRFITDNVGKRCLTFYYRIVTNKLNLS